jgi:succinate dehydrogenase flavin-adding protein (antitoxin of CptAB toxin-antitoxin module)
MRFNSLQYSQVLSQTDIIRKRCIFQSHERGTLENDLLLGSFADKHLLTLEEKLLTQYNALIQQPDGMIFKWITGTSECPKELDISQIVEMVKLHCKSNPLKYPRETN